MIPLLIGAGIAGILGAVGTSVANERHEEVEQKHQEVVNTINDANDIYNNAKESLEWQQQSTDKALERFGECKYEVVTDWFPKFMECFEKFRNVPFNNTMYEDDSSGLSFGNVSYPAFKSMQKLSDAGDILRKATITSGAAGAAIALGAGVVTVDATLGAGAVASVASFAGVGAAANFALSGIGGLVPGVAVVAGPALLVGSFVSYYKADLEYQEAEKELEKAKSALAEAQVAAEKMETSEYICRTIERWSEMYEDLLERYMPLFKKSIQELGRIVNESSTIKVLKKPNIFTRFLSWLLKKPLEEKVVYKTVKKNNYKNLSDEEKKWLVISFDIAEIINSIVNTPILDTYGEINQKARELYDRLEDRIEKIEETHQILLKEIS